MISKLPDDQGRLWSRAAMLHTYHSYDIWMIAGEDER